MSVTVEGDAAGASATRSFDKRMVDAGGTVTVTIAAANYGQAGGVTETLPAGFTYVSSSLDSSQVTELSGNQVRFTLQGDVSFTYVVTASMTAETHTFSGNLRDFDRQDHDVSGASSVTVKAKSAVTPTPEANCHGHAGAHSHSNAHGHTRRVAVEGAADPVA